MTVSMKSKRIEAHAHDCGCNGCAGARLHENLHVLLDALDDLIHEGRVQGYDAQDGPSLDDPTGSLGRFHVALKEVQRAF